MLKRISIFAAVTALAVCGALASKPSEAQQSGPAGPGWYFVSVCGYYGQAAQMFCWFGQVGYFGPYTSEASCVSTVVGLMNIHAPIVSDPYAPSNCFYMN